MRMLGTIGGKAIVNQPCCCQVGVGLRPKATSLQTEHRAQQVANLGLPRLIKSDLPHYLERVNERLDDAALP